MSNLRGNITAIAIVVAAFAATPVLAAPGEVCTLGGVWYFHQDNGYDVQVDLKQDAAGTVKGVAHTNNQSEWATVTGKYNAKDFTFRFNIYWPNGALGKYRGYVQEDNYVSGTSAGVKWHSLEPIHCG